MAKKMRRYAMQFEDEKKKDSFGLTGFFKKNFEATSARVAKKKARRWAKRKGRGINFVQSFGRAKDQKQSRSIFDEKLF